MKITVNPRLEMLRLLIGETSVPQSRGSREAADRVELLADGTRREGE